MGKGSCSLPDCYLFSRRSLAVIINAMAATESAIKTTHQTGVIKNAVHGCVDDHFTRVRELGLC